MPELIHEPHRNTPTHTVEVPIPMSLVSGFVNNYISLRVYLMDYMKTHFRGQPYEQINPIFIEHRISWRDGKPYYRIHLENYQPNEAPK
jgi:hypothetical protein